MRRRTRRHDLTSATVEAVFVATSGICGSLAHGLLLAGQTVLALLFVLGHVCRMLALEAWQQVHHRDRRVLSDAWCRIPAVLVALWRRLRRADDVVADRLREGLRAAWAWLLPRLARAIRRLLGPERCRVLPG